MRVSLAIEGAGGDTDVDDTGEHYPEEQCRAEFKSQVLKELLHLVSLIHIMDLLYHNMKISTGLLLGVLDQLEAVHRSSYEGDPCPSCKDVLEEAHRDLVEMYRSARRACPMLMS